MQTIKTNPILRDEKKFMGLDEIYVNFKKKKEVPSCFYNYAADRGVEFSGYVENNSGDFVKSLGLNA